MISSTRKLPFCTETFLLLLHLLPCITS
jgi:hypothetical protein